MKEVVVLSGKGGVGKSSVAASLGTLLSKKRRMVLVDCDVDAPNLALIFGAKADTSLDVFSSEKAFIDYERCSECFTCVQTCRFHAIVEAEKPVVVPFYCEGCGACAIACPEDAIEIRPVANGKIDISKSNGTSIVTGALKIGESGSGNLVFKVRKEARKKAEENGVEMILIDGPPGIGCPVIASVSGTDYVIAVTEPTPAALNDLKRVLEVVKHFKIPAGVVINKAGLNDAVSKKIKDFARSAGLSILAEMPYDLSIPKSLVQARPVVEIYPDSEVSLEIKRLAEKFEGVLERI